MNPEDYFLWGFLALLSPIWLPMVGLGWVVHTIWKKVLHR